MESSGFVLSKSAANDASVASWIDGPLSPELELVPGVGSASTDAFREAGVSNAYQLVGYFLMLKNKGSTVQEHMDLFYRWLRFKDEGGVGLKANAHTIARAVAERVNLMCPGIYDEKKLTRKQ